MMMDAIQAVHEAEVAQQTWETKSGACVEMAKRLEVRNQGGAEEARKGLILIKGEVKLLDGERKKLKAPINEAGKRVEALFRAPLKEYREAETILKKKVLEWQEAEKAKERKRLAKEADKREAKIAKLQERADELSQSGLDSEAEAVQTEVDTLVSRQNSPEEDKAVLDNISTRESWECEVTDLRALCQAILDNQIKESAVEPNEKALREVAKVAGPMGIKIPGLRFYSKRTLAVRVD